MTENNKEVSDAIKGGLTSAWGWFNTAKEAVATTSAKMAEKLPEKMEKAIESMKAMEDKPKEEIDSGCVPWNARSPFLRQHEFNIGFHLVARKHIGMARLYVDLAMLGNCGRSYLATEWMFAL